MANMDEDGNGMIDLYEFADNFIDIIKKLRFRQIECEEKMLANYESLKVVKDKLKNLAIDDNYSSGPFQKQCQLNIIQCKNLPNNMRRPYIKLLYQSANGGRTDINNTQNASYENPVFNQRFQFDVHQDADSVVIQLIDSTIMGQKLETLISFNDLRNYMMDQTFEFKELWFEFRNPENTQVRIMFNYLFSRRMMLENEVMSWQNYLNEDCTDYANIEKFLEELQKPYREFLNWKGEREERIGMTFDEIQLEMQEKEKFKKRFNWFHKLEKNIVDKQVDDKTTKVMR